MRNFFQNLSNFFRIDWILFVSTLPLLGAGLVTMSSYTGADNYFEKQFIWIVIALALFFITSLIDFRFLRRTEVITIAFIICVAVLGLLFAVGHVSKGAQSWFRLGLFSIQPADPAKLIIILLLAKYFSKRHVEIANLRHIIISGIYAFIIFILILLQPDFGSAIIIFLIWLGIVLVSGISKKHLIMVFLIGAVVFLGLWNFGFKEYQKERIRNFIHPLADIQGSGYNAYQSTITVGSGQMLGKGIGYGTQSRLNFLPEYQTDFIFAAFAEEWGFIGVTIILLMFGIFVWRILINSLQGGTNFEILYGLGLAIYFVTHFTINVGMNLGLLPVTGITVPFMSYGGSHIITSFLGLGILMGMRRYGRPAHKDVIKNEFLGIH
jgi:rod shape determining protein RodA